MVSATKTAMFLDLALSNGGKANKALRAMAGVLVLASFAGGATPALLEAAAMVPTKNSSPEIVSLFSTLVRALRAPTPQSQPQVAL